MVGGTVVQRVGNRVEVLCETNFDRTWRGLPDGADVETGDRVWWQGGSTFCTRKERWADRDMGRSWPADPPRRPG